MQLFSSVPNSLLPKANPGERSYFYRSHLDFEQSEMSAQLVLNLTKICLLLIPHRLIVLPHYLMVPTRPFFKFKVDVSGVFYDGDGRFQLYAYFCSPS